MSKRREKNKPQKPQLNKQLEAETGPKEQNNASGKRIRAFKYELGKFMVDIAKLVFAGVIVAGIMDEDIDRQMLFMLGSAVVLTFAFLGLTIISINKEEK